jgi:hypothetical protein
MVKTADDSFEGQDSRSELLKSCWDALKAQCACPQEPACEEEAQAFGKVWSIADQH